MSGGIGGGAEELGGSTGAISIGGQPEIRWWGGWGGGGAVAAASSSGAVAEAGRARNKRAVSSRVAKTQKEEAVWHHGRQEAVQRQTKSQDGRTQPEEQRIRVCCED